MSLTSWRGMAVAGMLLQLVTAVPGPSGTGAGAGCPLLIAHQGYTGSPAGRGLIPANSAAALRNAVRRGAPAVEFDVRWSRNDVPVIVHDPTVDATTWWHGHVGTYPAAVLDRMRLRIGAASTPDYVPSLMTVLQTVAALHVQAIAEIKTASVTAVQADAFNAAVTATGTRRLISIHGFFRASLARFAGYPLTLLTVTPVTSAPGDVGVDMAGSIVTAARIAALHAGGLATGAYTTQGSGVADDAATWSRLASDGVDRIITDNTPGYRQWCTAAAGQQTVTGSASARRSGRI